MRSLTKFTVVTLIAIFSLSNFAHAGTVVSREVMERLQQQKAEKAAAKAAAKQAKAVAKFQQKQAIAAAKASYKQAVAAAKSGQLAPLEKKTGYMYEPEKINNPQMAAAQSFAQYQPKSGYETFLGAVDDAKVSRLADLGYTTAEVVKGGEKETYSRPASENNPTVETIEVKRDAKTGDVIAIVQTIEDPATGQLTTNLVDYLEKSSSHCSNLSAQTGKPGPSTQCSTISSNLCTKFNSEPARKEIMPVHYQNMSAQLQTVKKVAVGERSPLNNLVPSDQDRCQTLASNLEIDRPVKCMAIGCEGNAVAVNPTERDPASAPTAPAPLAPSTGLWGVK